MPRFLALTSRGLGEPLQRELQEIGIKKCSCQHEGVYFEGSWQDAYRVNLRSRIATRVLLPILDFKVYNVDDLYAALLKKHDFTKYILPAQTLAIEAHVSEHREFRDQRFLAQKAKDAIVDQFREKFGERPNVDAKNPDFRVVVRLAKTDASVAIDLTGTPLSQRGYRSKAGPAPLRENLAAGLLSLANWTADQVLVDPMCGSGTILIEAALKARNLINDKRKFLFQNFQNYQKEKFEEARKEIKRRNPDLKLYGFDVDPTVLSQARENARLAGVEQWIHFRQADIRDLKAPVNQPGLVISNPPYAIRMNSIAQAQSLWKALSSTMKAQFPGWTCWVLSGNKEFSEAFHLKNQERLRIFNGPVECRFLKYEIN